MAIPPGFEEADDGTLQEIIREAEAYLNSQLTASLAADQRAISFASLIAAAIVAIVTAGAFVILDADSPNALGWTSFGIAAGFLVSMAFAISAAMPADFWFPGNTPQNWVSDVQRKLPLKVSLGQQADHYSDMIAENNRIMRRNNKQMAIAIWIAWASLFAGGGAVLYLLTRAA